VPLKERLVPRNAATVCPSPNSPYLTRSPWWHGNPCSRRAAYIGGGGRERGDGRNLRPVLSGAARRISRVCRQMIPGLIMGGFRRRLREPPNPSPRPRRAAVRCVLKLSELANDRPAAGMPPTRQPAAGLSIRTLTSHSRAFLAGPFTSAFLRGGEQFSVPPAARAVLFPVDLHSNLRRILHGAGRRPQGNWRPAEFREER